MHRRAIVRLILLVFLFSWSTKAVTVELFDGPSKCSDLRLDSKGEVFWKLPVYNQKIGSSRDANICYAITAAWLIDADRRRKSGRLESLSSPLSIALLTRYNNVTGTSGADPARKYIDDTDPFTYLLAGGTIVDALHASRGRAVCDQQSLESYASLIGGHANSQSMETFLSEFTAPDANGTPGPALIQSALNKTNTHCRLVPGYESSEPQTLKMPKYLTELKSVLDNSAQQTPEQKAQSLADLAQRFSEEGKAKFFADTMMKLLNQKIPIGVDYVCRESQTTDPIYSSALHASVIVGRRFNQESKSCEFLVRDSYGPNCEDSNGRPRYRVPCENGSFWVDDRKLIAELRSLTWIP